MRNCKEIDYYNQFIEVIKKSEEKSKDRVQSGLVREDMIDSIKFLWLAGRIKVLIAKFSKGDDTNDLKKEYSNLIKEMEPLWTKKAVKLKDNKGNILDMYILDCYIYMRWLLSLAILFDVSDEEFKILTDLIKRDNIKDKLYDYLISSRFKNWKVSDSMSLKNPENKIQEIIDIQDKTECENNLKLYLNKEWYKTYKYFGFYNSHKKPENMFLFYGYWAFEVAALVKIKGLDDSSFKDNPYYPSRLL